MEEVCYNSLGKEIGSKNGGTYMKQLKGIIISIIAILSILVAVYEAFIPTEPKSKKEVTYDQVLEFPKERYPETGNI